MVCVPCIILPVLLGIYLKFIQPFILRFVPDRWKETFDAFLYPTCPIQSKKPTTTDNATTNEKLIAPEEDSTCCKKDN